MFKNFRGCCYTSSVCKTWNTVCADVGGVIGRKKLNCMPLPKMKGRPQQQYCTCCWWVGGLVGDRNASLVLVRARKMATAIPLTRHFKMIMPKQNVAYKNTKSHLSIRFRNRLDFVRYFITSFGLATIRRTSADRST